VRERFATTDWKVVAAARDGSASEVRAAIEVLCERYWYPLYAYVRRGGRSHDEAADLAQGFFADLLARDFLQRIDPDRGRFRSFFLAAFKHYLTHVRDREQAQKRGGAVSTISLDFALASSRFEAEPADADSPEALYERRWGMTVMERAMERLRAETMESGHPERFDALREYLTGTEPRVAYEETAVALGMSENALKAAVHRFRGRFGQLLREEVAATVAEASDVDAEIRYLLGVLRPWRDASA
jgi:RNA polymerase sigma-70 factor (ECF subfamily)